MSSQSANAPRLFKPATAIRIDNDVFLGSPLPPEEPTAKNPPDGAIIDYYLPTSGEERRRWRLSIPVGKLVRRYDSGPKKEPPHPPLAIAERWIAKPVLLQNTAGAHRFVWDLRWGSSGQSAEAMTMRASEPRVDRAAAPGQLSAETDSRRQHDDAAVEAHNGSALASHTGRVERTVAARAGDLRRTEEHSQGPGRDRRGEETDCRLCPRRACRSIRSCWRRSRI